MISSHHWGKDEDTDEAFTSVHESLDELKEMEEKEFGVAVESREEKDGTTFVEAQSRDEESAFDREQEEGEKADIEALRKADKMVMDPANYPAERNPNVSCGWDTPQALCLSTSQSANSCRLRRPRLQLRLPEFCCVRNRMGRIHQQQQQQYLVKHSSSLRKQLSSSNLRSRTPSTQLYISPHRREAKESSSTQKSQK